MTRLNVSVRMHLEDEFSDPEHGPCVTLDRHDEAHLIMLCWHHHLDGWATSKPALALQRDHLRMLHPEAWAR